MNKYMIVVAMLGAVLTAGCIDATTTVMLNGDGSGQILETVYLSAGTTAMVSGFMGAQAGGTNAASAGASSIMDEAKARAKAVSLGEGVTFVKMTEVTRDDGAKGAHVIYKFDDITKISITPGESDGAGAGARAQKKEPVTFGFETGKLTINMPRAGSAGEEAPTPPKSPQQQQMAAAMMQGMLPMLRGMRMRIAVQLPKPIRKTNATFVHSGGVGGPNRLVTLLDFDLDTLIETEGGTQKFVAMQSTQGFQNAARVLSNVPGIKIESQPTVIVEF